MDKDLKIFALEYVKIHDDLLKEQKLAIGKFIMEASDDQVKYMLLSGEVKDKLTREDLKFTKESWQGQYMSTASQQDLAAGGASAAIWSMIAIKAAHVAYKRFLSQAAKACKGMSGLDKTNCMSKFKKKAQAAKVQSLQSGLSKCSKDKNPAKCKAKVQKALNKEKAKMGAL